MKSYSDVEFADKVSDKLGNVVVFKRILRNYNLIGIRKQLTDEHINIFKDAKRLQATDMKWEDAFETVIKPLAEDVVQGEMDEQEGSDLSDAINRLADNMESMNRILLRIEKKL
ncbi:TPA: hypothetical protein QCY54_000551 [Bacillus cereus]|nr:hypothetical protein [Bacillus cereus]